jgi:hypothetical protein
MKYSAIKSNPASRGNPPGPPALLQPSAVPQLVAFMH